MNGLGADLPPGALSLLTALGDSAVALALFLFLLRRHLHLAPVVLIASLLGLVFTHSFKQFMPLMRPGGLLEPGSFHSVGALVELRSFPSGHSQTALTLAAVFMLAAPAGWQRALLLALGLAAALSRVLVGVHWPIDVLVGAAGGLLCTLAAAWLVHRVPGCVNVVTIWLVALLCLAAALMLCFGHPDDYPLAAPVLKPVGAAALACGLFGMVLHPLWQRLGARRPGQ